MQCVAFRGRPWWIKRDDQLWPFPGNKGRKLLGLLQRDWSGVEQLVSHGGNQSNAMLAIARLARLKGLPFRYSTRPMPAWLKDSPTGNLAAALELGMQLAEARKAPAAQDFGPETCFIPQGAAMPEAQVGLTVLAREVETDAEVAGLRDPLVFLPSGTGATALYLQQALPFEVWTTPCAGDAAYLRRQFRALVPDARLPRILPPADRQPFGRPATQYLTLWQELRAATGIEFDLLYDPKGWLTLLRDAPDRPVIYLHCGGVEGNASMLARYRRLGCRVGVSS